MFVITYMEKEKSPVKQVQADTWDIAMKKRQQIISYYAIKDISLYMSPVIDEVTYDNQEEVVCN